MRDYGTVSPQFWIGSTGKALRGNAHAQLLALYLMTNPHSNMIGVYHCPLLYMAHETGLPFEGASKALQSLIEADFCSYDEATETVFVHRMAAHQIAESLKPSDNRVKGVERDVQSIISPSMKAAFLDAYGVAFNLRKHADVDSPSEAPSKALRSQEQEQEQEHDIGAASADTQADDPAASDPAAKPPKARTGRGSRLPDDWKLPKAWGEWTLTTFPNWTPDDVRLEADKFADHWRSKAGKDACKTDWQGTWRNWCRSDIAQRGKAAAVPTGGNWRSNPVFAGVI